MNNKLRITLMAIVAAALVGCQTSEEALKEAGAKQLTYAELTKIYSVPRTVAWSRADGAASGTSVFQPNGTATVSWERQSDTGTWRIVGYTFCEKWIGALRGAENCYSVYKLKYGSFMTINDDGNVFTTFSFK